MWGKHCGCSHFVPSVLLYWLLPLQMVLLATFLLTFFLRNMELLWIQVSKFFNQVFPYKMPASTEKCCQAFTVGQRLTWRNRKTTRFSSNSRSRDAFSPSSEGFPIFMVLGRWYIASKYFTARWQSTVSSCIALNIFSYKIFKHAYTQNLSCQAVQNCTFVFLRQASQFFHQGLYRVGQKFKPLDKFECIIFCLLYQHSKPNLC